jgi:hypothetical protein
MTMKVKQEIMKAINKSTNNIIPDHALIDSVNEIEKIINACSIHALETSSQLGEILEIVGLEIKGK